jgi:hypothetical protein
MTAADAAIDRSPMRRWLLVVAALAGGASATGLPAQGVDYARADRIRTFDALLVGGRVYPVWLSDSVRFYYEMTGAGPTGERSTSSTHARGPGDRCSTMPVSRRRCPLSPTR